MTTVVSVEPHAHILQVSQVNAVQSNETGIGYGGGNNQAARVKGNTVDWDDWGE